jgi:hypothetical protein
MSEIGDKLETSQVCWFMLIIPALGRLRQEDCKFQPSLVCRVGPCLKKKKKDKKQITGLRQMGFAISQLNLGK